MFQIENFFNLGLTKDEYRSIIYTIKKNKHKEGVDDDVWFSDAPPTICL